ncbi:MAG: sensor histidine kinase [Actinobacteria bacterium]|nr:sensor histidine kinase [Actinomycetota bacterium]
MEDRSAKRDLLDRHYVAVDALLVTGLLATGVAEAASRSNVGAIEWILIPVMTLPLLWRRRAPALVFMLLAVIAFGQWLTASPTFTDIALLVALYEVASKESFARMVAAVGVMGIGAVLTTLRWSGTEPLHLFVFLCAIVVAPAALGRTAQVRRKYLHSLEERAERLESERDAQGQIAAAAERARIAREMHDIVAHNLSVMTALAGGARYSVHRDPDEAARVMDLSASTGREALADMRRLLGVLHDEDDPSAPQPGIDNLPDLLDQVRLAGLDVTLLDEGGSEQLPATMQLTVYRMIQEALTNSLKHAGPGAAATVSMRRDRAGVDLEVIDRGGADGPAEVAPSGGQGLNGMRERAAVYDGAVEAGPTADGGWRVQARLRIPGPEGLPT